MSGPDCGNLASAFRLCEASYGTLWVLDDNNFRNVALHGALPSAFVAELLRTSPPPPGARPVPRGRPVGHRWPRLEASRVAYAFLVCMLPPLPRRSGWAYSCSFTQPYQPSPKGLSGRPAHLAEPQ